VPGALIAVVAATAASAWFDLAARGVATVGTLPQGLPAFRLPLLGMQETLALAAGAVGIAVISLTDTSVLSQSFASRFSYEVDADQEFTALGAANVAAGLFQGFPVSGSQTRSAISVAAGAKSQLTGVVAAVTVGLLLVLAPGLLGPLPISVLAAVIIGAGFEMADVGGTVRLFALRHTEFYLSIAALLGVIVLGVLPGVFVAVGLSMLNFIRRQWWPHDAVLGRVPGVKGYHDIGDFTEATQVPGLLIFRFDAPLFFANANIFRQRLSARMKAQPEPVRRVVIAAEPLIDVDTTAADSLTELIGSLQARGIEVAFAELKHPVRERLERYGIIEQVGQEMLFPTLGSAVHDYVSKLGVEWVDWEDEA
jgi:MFS superfamily sulfate permease-like transporter